MRPVNPDRPPPTRADGAVLPTEDELAEEAALYAEHWKQDAERRALPVATPLPTSKAPGARAKIEGDPALDRLYQRQRPSEDA